MWNSLPSVPDSSLSLNMFQWQLKTYLVLNSDKAHLALLWCICDSGTIHICRDILIYLLTY